MRNNNILDRLPFASLALVLLAAPAAAQTNLGFDPTSNVIEIPSSATPSRSDAVTCYIFEDAIIRISATDSPAPDDALILPPPEKGTPAKCGRSKPEGIELSSHGSYLVGRLGDFLVFKLADAGGASQFTVFNVHNGHQLFSDGVFGGDGYLGTYGIASVKVAGGILHMRYRRGVNTNCSLLSDRDRCWARLLSNGDVPRDVFSGPPAAETCKKSYEGDHGGIMSPPDDDPSIVAYDVDLTLDIKGNVNVRPLGTPLCYPMP